MLTVADREGLAEAEVRDEEWAAWRGHRVRIRLLVLATAAIVFASITWFALRPLTGVLTQQQHLAATSLLEQSARLFEARNRVLLERSRRLSADAELERILMAPRLDRRALMARLQALLPAEEELVGLAVARRDGRRLAGVGQMPHQPLAGTAVTVQTVRFPLDDSGLVYTLPLRNAAGDEVFLLQLFFDGRHFFDALSNQGDGLGVPFLLVDGQVYFSQATVRARIAQCGGVEGLLSHDCQGEAVLLQRPLSGADWSLALLLDARGHVDLIQQALRWLPAVLLLVLGALLLLTASVIRPLNRLFARTDRLYEMSARDELTGLSNRRHLMGALDAELARAARQRLAINVMLLDIDRFKGINDRHGHAVGDLAIKEVAQAVATLSRTEDVAARLGGDEFVVVQTNVDLTGAVRFAERLRRSVGQIRVPSNGGWVRLSVSIGVAHIPAGKVSQVSRERVLGIADRALYKAKAAGRNKVAARGLRERPQLAASNS